MHPIAAIKAFWKALFNSFKLKGEAAVKLAENDAKADKVKARIAVVRAANSTHADLVTSLRIEAARHHADADDINAQFDKLLAKL